MSEDQHNKDNKKKKSRSTSTGSRQSTNTSRSNERRDTVATNRGDDLSTQIADHQSTITTGQPESVDEDIPVSPIGKLIKNFTSTGNSRLNISSQLLPGEQLLASKLVIYFDEVQILAGLVIILSSFITFFSFNLGFGISIILFLAGLSLAATGFASEDLYITNSRVLVRRMTWIDKMFRIPRDSQYILNEIVSFDVQRAPMNSGLFYTGLIPLILLLWQEVRNSIISIIIIIGITLLLVIISQRLGKRTLSFSMSGGHQVFLGIYKGIPNSVIQAFIAIIMEKNIFESDDY